VLASVRTGQGSQEEQQDYTYVRPSYTGVVCHRSRTTGVEVAGRWVGMLSGGSRAGAKRPGDGRVSELGTGS